MANIKSTTTRKVVTPEFRKEEVTKVITKKDVLVCRNVICKYGVFEAGQTYSVDSVTESKLIGLGAIKCY